MASRNYLEAGALIAQRLRDECPELRHVLEAHELTKANLAMAKPLAIVSYVGESIPQSGQLANGRDCQVTQGWQVEIVVDTGNAPAASSQAGFLMYDAIRALQGWKPFLTGKWLYRVSPPRPEYGPGYAIYPLQFELPLMASAAT